MTTNTPGLPDRHEGVLWLAGLAIALLLHLSVFFIVPASLSWPVHNQAPAAVMLNFSEATQSIQIPHTLPIGPPQAVSPEEHVTQPEPQAEVKAEAPVHVDDSPLARQPQLVVARDKTKPRKPPKNKVSKVRHKPEKTPRQQQTPAQVESRAWAQSTAAPPPGDATQVAAAYDSRSQNAGTRQTGRRVCLATWRVTRDTLNRRWLRTLRARYRPQLLLTAREIFCLSGLEKPVVIRSWINMHCARSRANRRFRVRQLTSSATETNSH